MARQGRIVARNFVCKGVLYICKHLQLHDLIGLAAALYFRMPAYSFQTLRSRKLLRFSCTGSLNRGMYVQEYKDGTSSPKFHGEIGIYTNRKLEK